MMSPGRNREGREAPAASLARSGSAGGAASMTEPPTLREFVVYMGLSRIIP